MIYRLVQAEISILLYLAFVSWGLWCLALCPAAAQELTIQRDLNAQLSCTTPEGVVLSGIYSPYSVHLIRSQVSGRIVKVNGKEGQMLPAGVPVVEVDSWALKGELKSLEEALAALREARELLTKKYDLAQKKYTRYLRLGRSGHIQGQLVEDMQSQLDSAKLALVENRRQQAEIRGKIIQLKEEIKRCNPTFDRDLYVSRTFKELYETVVPGDKICKLLDVSKAKVHLVVSPGCYRQLLKRLSSNRQLTFEIYWSRGRSGLVKGRVEKLKLDPDSQYLYSYGFDLVFSPVKGLLWGESVRIRLKF